MADVQHKITLLFDEEEALIFTEAANELDVDLKTFVAIAIYEGARKAHQKALLDIEDELGKLYKQKRVDNDGDDAS